MPMKPIKRRYKIWVRADQTGFISEFEIYTGKTDSVESSLGKRVVLTLTNKIQGKYHRVFFDNFFTSLDLMEDLLKNKVYGCGTVRGNRKGLPINQLNDKKMKRGDSEGRTSTTNVSWIKWKDNRPIQFLSNYHDPDHLTSCLRKAKDGSSASITCPTMVKDYNKNMGYVDYADMMKSYYEIDRKSHKWWHRIFFHFLDVAVTNSYILFKLKCQGRNIPLKDFRLAVVAGLVGVPTTSPRGKQKSFKNQTNNFKVRIPLEMRFANVAHIPKSCTIRRCHNCSTKENPKRSRWECSTCNVALCLTSEKNCFETFHKK
jgi:hypothetical protein